MSVLPNSPKTPDGVSFTWIFDHVLRNPMAYEIPLRDMYTLNCNPPKTFLPGNNSPETAFTPRASTSTQASNSSQDSCVDAAADFRSQLIHQISRIPSQPCSLPPSFLTSFLRRCFPRELEQVDFPQGLTALDYARDLETRWKKEMSLALQRLNIGREEAANIHSSDLAVKYPGVVTWVKSINAKARTLEVLYTQVYIGLRRWVIINEVLLEPHNKHNHIALLNTLYPPVSPGSKTPTPQLNYQILKSHRDAFFNIINKVSTRGTGPVYQMIHQGEREQGEGSWPEIHKTLERYLDLVNEVIDECTLVNEPSHFDDSASSHRSKTRKVDSGCSFGTTGSDISIAEGDIDKPLPQFPVPTDKDFTPTRASVLDRFTHKAKGPAQKLFSIRHMKSSISLGRPDSRQSTHSFSLFEVSEEKRSRLVRDAQKRRGTQS